MANTNSVKLEFDQALTDAGYSVNDPKYVSTTQASDGLHIKTFSKVIPSSDNNIANHQTLDIEYEIKVLVVEKDDVTRKNLASEEFEKVMQVIFSNLGSSDAENIELSDSDEGLITGQKMQSMFIQNYTITYQSRRIM